MSKEPKYGTRFISSYLGTKRKYGEKIAQVLANTSFNGIYDVFGGSGSLSCQLAHLSSKIVYNEKNIFISKFIEIAYSQYLDGTFDKWWTNEILPFRVTDKESYMRCRDRFNFDDNSAVEKCYAYYWLNNTCTSSLVRWNRKKLDNNPWYFNQAYCGKVVNPDSLKQDLLTAFEAVEKSDIKFLGKDYRDLRIPTDALILADPPYDNTYNGYIPEDWDSEAFVNWVTEKAKTNKICIFGSTKVDDFSDTKNLKPFFDQGWKVLVLSNESFKSVSPHGDSDNKQSRTKQIDVMLYNF